MKIHVLVEHGPPWCAYEGEDSVTSLVHVLRIQATSVVLANGESGVESLEPLLRATGLTRLLAPHASEFGRLACRSCREIPLRAGDSPEALRDSLREALWPEPDQEPTVLVVHGLTSREGFDKQTGARMAEVLQELARSKRACLILPVNEAEVMAFTTPPAPLSEPHVRAPEAVPLAPEVLSLLRRRPSLRLRGLDGWATSTVTCGFLALAGASAAWLIRSHGRNFLPPPHPNVASSEPVRTLLPVAGLEGESASTGLEPESEGSVSF